MSTILTIFFISILTGYNDTTFSQNIISTMHRLELSNEISHLHVLVCGQCHLVFHFIDQFLSHTQHCHHQRHQQQSSGEDDNSSVETLAVTMWTNSVARVVDDMNTDEAPDIRKRIMHKWLSLSEGFRRCWLEAARNLIQLSNIRRYLEEEDNQDTQPSLVMDNSVASASEPTITEAPSVKRKSPKQTRNFNNVRDERGRWASNNPNPRSENEFKCETCQFETNSKWKIERHLTTRKHLDNVEAATQEDVQQTVEILDDEIEQLDKLQDEREFLYESPCDIIMEDS